MLSLPPISLRLRGRKFAGRNAEIVLAGGESVADMKGYRDDVMKHARELGRDTSRIKTLFTCVPTVVKSPSDVAETRDQLAKGRAHHFERGLAAMSFRMVWTLASASSDRMLP